MNITVRMRLILALAVGVPLAWAAPSRAQSHTHSEAPADSTAHEEEMPRMDMGHDMTGHHPGHDMEEHQHAASMTGFYGAYPMSREASGTAWQPELGRHHGLHFMKGAWTLMLHGMADLVFDDQRGPRGDNKVFSSNMLMGMAQRAAGPGKLGIRVMVSAEPSTIGKEGYPLLLQTGETADGSTPLIDRQHPHDLFMELAGSYSVSMGERSIFLYAGLPGEPALGPPAFMHRFSGIPFPEAPISHHWLDSSHITFGVLTAGAVAGGVKLEASAFRGREPDQDRFGIESPKLDSHAFRVSVNPTPAWAFQVSRGRMKSPEQLEPDVDVDRTTASVIQARDWGGGHWEAMAAWGRNRQRPGPTLDAFNLETALQLHGRHTIFARMERVQKNELFEESDPRAGNAYWVGKAGAGYRFDFRSSGSPRVGIGVLGSLISVPEEIRDAYGRSPTAVMLFTHVEL